MDSEPYIYKNRKMELLIFQNTPNKTFLSVWTFYKDKTYNIPVCLWLEESYPQTAPICYVRPTRDMLIIRGKYISSNGEVLMPYLEEWKTVRTEYCFIGPIMRNWNIQPWVADTASFPLSGQMWPGDYTASDGCHVWRLSTTLYAVSSRARTRLM